jgi:hypothetical protein
VPTLAQDYERRADDYTRAAEQTDDPVFRCIAALWGVKSLLRPRSNRPKLTDRSLDLEIHRRCLLPGVIRLFRASYGTELNVDLLERHGFTISEELQNAILAKIKLDGLDIGSVAQDARSGQGAATNGP